MRKNGKVVGMDGNGSLWIFLGRAALLRTKKRRGALPLPGNPDRDGIYKKTSDLRPMKKKAITILISLSAMALLAGCDLDMRFGGGSRSNSTVAATTTSNNTATNNNQHPAVVQQAVAPTVGQQLIDLKKALDAGAMTETEYEAEKAKLLNQK